MREPWSRRRTKIIATVGPAVAGGARLGRLIRAGADVLRFNFSHGTIPGQLGAMAAARLASRRAGKYVSLLADLCGPKIRTGPVPQGGIALARGRRLEIVAGGSASTARRISVTYAGLAREVRPGQRVLLADGRMELRIEAVRRGRITARVVRPGILGSNKGVNLPGARLSVPALTAQDRRVLKFLSRAAPDYVALSFVRSARDLRTCRRAMDGAGLGAARLIAKIEKPEAIEDLEAILESCDGIMVARGDLGVEMPAEGIPCAQRAMAAAAARHDRLCIVATEMFESMISSPRPTRAEVSDVACAVRDHADAVMLSAETSTGSYPFEAVRAMARVLHATDRAQAEAGFLSGPGVGEAYGGPEDALAISAKLLSREVGGAVLAAATKSGRTALFLSKARSSSPILGLSPSERALNRMALYWGVLPVRIPSFQRHAALLDEAARCARRFAGAKPGGRVIILSGTPLGRGGTTNTLHLRRI